MRDTQGLFFVMLLRSLVVASVVWISSNTSPTAQQIVILKSSSEALKAGQIFDSTHQINLSANEMIVFNTAFGETRKLHGPYSGPLPVPGGAQSQGPSFVESLSRLVAARKERDEIIAASRGVLFSAKYSHNTILLGSGEPQCLERGRPADLSLPQRFSRAKLLEIHELASDLVVALEWRQPPAKTLWPSSLRPGDGASYKVHWPQDLMARVGPKLRLVTIDPHERLDAKAVAMEQAGCERQALIILDEMLDDE